MLLGHPHEGSSYPSQKVLQTAWHRLEHAKSRISELDNHRNRLGADLPRTSSTVPKQGTSWLATGEGSCVTLGLWYSVSKILPYYI